MEKIKDSKEKVVLAYSGGLDTSVILKWLINKGYEVICFVCDVGQEEDFDSVEEKALKIGASKVFVIDAKKEFVEDYIFQALKGNLVYDNKYLLGTSIARPLIAKKQIEIAKKEGAKIVSHGATGKGNDQVRFEIAYLKLMPDVKIYSPWKDKEFLSKFEGRKDLLEYAEKEDIPVEATSKKPYSMDDNIMHISYEAGQLEDPMFEPQADMFKKSKSPEEAPDKVTEISIEFKEGVPIKVVNKNTESEIVGSLELFEYLNKLGGENGIGREDIVENRFVGMKSRGVYETPAGTILLKAHIDIENLVLDREVLHLKNMLMPKIASIVYNGFWFSPEMEFLMSSVDCSQKDVEGIVHLKLYKGNVVVIGRESEKSLYDADIASMDIEGGYEQEDAKGFIKLNALRLMIGAKK